MSKSEAILELTPTQTMGEILQNFPGARRALFRAYHIGGCSNCGFQMTETLEEVCNRNDNVTSEEAVATILSGHENDLKLLISPQELHQKIEDREETLLIDIRSREEFEAVSIPSAHLLTQELSQKLMGEENYDQFLVFYDHLGNQVLDAASYFIGHGFRNVRCLKGGIDGWAEKVDSSMRRYRLEK